MGKRKFRILALDGGGIRGVISAQILEQFQKKIGQPLNEYFDLIAGTSTGSILAASLVLGKSPTELIDIYRDRGQDIFQTNFFRKNISYLLNQPKYSNKGLKQVLQEHFGEILLDDLREESKKLNPGSNPKTRLLILAYSTTQRYTQFFLSPLPKDEQTWYQKAKLWEVCLSSSAAPTFFPPYKFNLSQAPETETAGEYTFVDGGVSANNPSLSAVIHALDYEKLDGKKIEIEDISLLSVGTGKTTQPYEFKEVNSWGLVNWGTKITDVFMGGQLQISADLCHQLIYSMNPQGYLRIQFEMNERYQKNTNEPVRLPKNQQVNAYTKKPLNEAMDLASVSHIKDLIETTKSFLDSTDCYSKLDGIECSVDRAIENFIEANQ